MAASSSQDIDAGEGDAQAVDMKEELKRVLLEYADELIKPGDSTEELLSKLEKLEHLLQHITQDLKELVEPALKPAKAALISDALLRHDELDVRFTAASCISEIIRITAPEEPYKEDKMKDYFQLVISALQKLPSCSGRAYSKLVSVLQTISHCQICVMMLDYQLHAMVHEMFHLFLDGIQVNHDEAVFSSMEHIMSLMIQNDGDSDESSMELAKILLATLKKGNQNVSPPAFQLAKKVFENCARDLKDYLQEAVRFTEVAVEEYDDVVVSSFKNATQRHSMDATEREKIVSSHGEVNLARDSGLSKFVKNDANSLKDDKNVSENHAMVSNLGCQINTQECDLDGIDLISQPTVDCPEVNNPSIDDGSNPVNKSITDELCNDNPKDQNIKQQHSDRDITNQNNVDERSGSKNVTDICLRERDSSQEYNPKLMTLEEVSQMKDHDITSQEKFSEQPKPVDADSTFQPERVGSPNNMQQKIKLDDVPIPQKRSRKPHSLITPDEGYDPLWMLTECVSIEGSSHRKNSWMHADYRNQNTILKTSQLSPSPAGEPFNAPPSDEHSFPDLKPQNKCFPEKQDVIDQDNGVYVLLNSVSNLGGTATCEDISGMDSTKENLEKTPEKDYSITLTDGILKNSVKRKRSLTRVARAKKRSKNIEPDTITSNDLADLDNSKKKLRESLEKALPADKVDGIQKHFKKRRGSSKKVDHAEKSEENNVICEDPSEDFLIKTLISKPRSLTTKWDNSAEVSNPKFQRNVILPKEQFKKKKCSFAKNVSGGTSKGKTDIFECRTGDTVVKKTLGETSMGKTVISETQTGDIIAKTLTSQSKRKACSKEISNSQQQMVDVQSKKEAFEVTPANKCHGEELVGCKIKVWWSMDQIFYEGTVASFNHLTKKHKVTYDDGEKERLDLTKECWEIIRDDNLSSQEQKTVSVPPSVLNVKSCDYGSKPSNSSKRKLKGLWKQILR